MIINVAIYIIYYRKLLIIIILKKKGPMAVKELIEEFTDDFLNYKVKGYAQYVIETRAIPQLMDGLRIGARKILYAGIKGDLMKHELIKMPELIGDTFKMKFHHGDASLKNTIEQLSMRHVFEYCPFWVDGQISTLRSDANTAARYLSVGKSQYIDLYLYDKELWVHKEEEGKKTEPKFYLPILPMSLLWRTNSPGYGFGFRSFSFDINNVIDACIQTVINGNCNGLNYVVLKPKIFGIDDENIIYNSHKDSWYNVGKYNLDIEDDTLYITDLPYNLTFDNFRDHLKELKEQNYITSFKDDMSAKGIMVVIKFHRGRLRHFYTEKFKFYQKMKMFTKIPKLDLNSLDTDGKTIMNFDSPQDLVTTFVRKRKLVYYERKSLMTKQINDKIVMYEDRIKFITSILSGALKINNRKIVDIKYDLDKMGISHEGLKLRISRLTQDEIEKSQNELNILRSLLDYYKNTSVETMYLSDLIDLKSKYLDIHTVDMQQVRSGNPTPDIKLLNKGAIKNNIDLTLLNAKQSIDDDTSN